ncbi:MAG: sn-glycerol-3-phosphate ABC transporter ATP-binding protein UgpC [Ignavibacteria bacterium]|jgi:multiple sugar transport system ATP-binding protein
MSSIKIKSVDKSYDGKTKVIENLSLDIIDGEFLVLVGPSGCGKSTLLRMIAGLEDITKGEIFIDDQLVNDTPPKDRNIAMVFQNYALYPHMSVYDNLGFGLRLRKFSKDEIDARVRKAAKTLGLEDYLKKKPKQLSGGQKQRVAVGRALVRQPKVFLFDEPLSNLDAKLRTQMRSELLRLHGMLKTTMVYVTHDQTEAMTMADRIVVLDKGKIQQIDTPINLYNNPANRFVAEFIGSPSMNFIAGNIEGDSVFENKNEKFKLTVSPGQIKNVNAGVNKNVVMGIRPEHIEVVFEKDESNLQGTIELIEVMGKESFLHLKSQEHKLIVRVDSSINLELGQTIHLKFDSNHIHLFPN